MGLSSKVCEFITDDVYNVDKGLFETEDKYNGSVVKTKI